MKPTTITDKSRQDFPLVDYQYHAQALGNLTGCCVKTSKSLRDISREYFAVEANHDFLSDAAVFGTLLIATAVLPIVAGVSAIIELCRTLPLF